MVTAIFWTLLGSAWAELPAGAPVPEAIDIQVGPEGLDVLAAAAPSLLPTDALAIDDTNGATGAPQFCLGYSYGLENISADFQIVDLALIPDSDALLLDAELLVSLNDPSNNFTLTLDANLSFIADTASVTPNQIGNQIVWDFGDLPLTGGGYFEVRVSIPNDPLGTAYTSQLEISSGGTETEPEDNSLAIEMMIMTSVYLPAIQR